VPGVPGIRTACVPRCVPPDSALQHRRRYQRSENASLARGGSNRVHLTKWTVRRYRMHRALPLSVVHLARARHRACLPQVPPSSLSVGSRSRQRARRVSTPWTRRGVCSYRKRSARPFSSHRTASLEPMLSWASGCAIAVCPAASSSTGTDENNSHRSMASLLVTTSFARTAPSTRGRPTCGPACSR
jgi:hypothetical protein